MDIIRKIRSQKLSIVFLVFGWGDQTGRINSTRARVDHVTSDQMDLEIVTRELNVSVLSPYRPSNRDLDYADISQI